MMTHPRNVCLEAADDVAGTSQVREAGGAIIVTDLVTVLIESARGPNHDRIVHNVFLLLN
jgi:hypothetical protein